MLIKLNVSTRRKMSCVQVKRRWSGEGAQKRREEKMEKKSDEQIIGIQKDEEQKNERGRTRQKIGHETIVSLMSEYELSIWMMHAGKTGIKHQQ